MANLSDSNSTSDRDNALVEIVGGNSPYLTTDVKNDGTNNRLCVDTKITGGSSYVFPRSTSKLRYVDMNASSGGVARGTNFVDVYQNLFSYSGSGLVYGFLLSLSNISSDWKINLIIDGEYIFGTDGISMTDIESNTIYGVSKDQKCGYLSGLQINGTTLDYQSQYPISYNTSVLLKTRLASGGPKPFYAGLMILSKET